MAREAIVSVGITLIKLVMVLKSLEKARFSSIIDQLRDTILTSLPIRTMNQNQSMLT